MSKAASGLPYGKYELLAKIGVGGMAEIYRARVVGPEGFEKILVVKRILPAYAKNNAFIEMLIAEAKVSSLLQHANIVQIYELGRIDGQFYIAMEYVHGADLLKMLAACTRLKTRIPIDLCLYVVSEMAKGLHYAHRATDHNNRPLNIIHRDVSPSNVLLSLDGEVKVMDFGVARADLETSGGRQRKKGGALKGKLGYMSPELVIGKEIDRRSDVFALGIILWEMLTLRRLFLGKTDVQTLVNIRDLNTRRKFEKHSYIPEGIQAIVARALAKDPEDRYPSAGDFQEAVLDYLFENRMRVSNRNLGAFLAKVLEADGSAPSRAISTATLGSSESDDAKAAKGPKAAKAAKGDSAEAAGDAKEAAPSDTDAADDVPAGAAEDTDSSAAAAPTDDKTDPDATALAAATAAATAAGSRPDPMALPEGFEPLADRAAAASASYRLVGDDGNPFGPVTFENLEKLLRSGAVGDREQISISDGPWVPIMRSGLPRVAPELFDDEADLPQFEGPLNRIRTPQLIYEVAGRRLTGKLKVTHGTTRKEIFFHEGTPVHVASNVRSELLANVLLERNHITREQLATALKALKKSNSGRMGDVLVSLGFLKPHDLYRVVELQFRLRFLDVFRWDSGWYEFIADRSPPQDIHPFNDDALMLITLGVRAHYDLPLMKAIFAEYVDQSLVLLQNPRISHHNLRFNSRELRFHTYFETGQTLRVTLERFGRTQEDILTILHVVFVLHQTGLLAFRPTAGPARHAP